MRVISGIKRGTNLFSPVTENTRPTTDRVRENIFNLIRFDLPGTDVLDLFSGSGAMGIEALSQGAQSCVFVDCDAKACEVINKNIEKTGFKEKSKVYKTSFDNYLNGETKKFDIIFLDPPYHKNLIFESINLILKKNLLKNSSIFVIECDNDENVNIPEGFVVLKEKIYGRVKVTLVKRGDII